MIFEDTADLDAAATAAVGAIFRDSGQVCIAASRLIVQQSIRAEFTKMVVEKARAMKVGDPLDLTTQVGAIASATQMNAIRAACDRAEAQGATRLTGGAQIMPDTGGYFIVPTIYDNAAPDSDLIQHEIFGPVLAMQGFETEDEAVALANGVDYGLSSGVFTADLSRAHRMIRRINAGAVHVNTYGGADVTVPLGGVSQSGNEHDKSPHAMDKFRNLKTAWIKL